MGYAFERDETVPAAVRRIMEEQIVRARGQLTDEASPVEKRVHDARKRFKETRALIRMVRAPLGDAYAAENAWFRDAGRTLSGARDAAAVIESLAKLGHGRRLPRLATRRLRAILQERHDAVAGADLGAVIAAVLDQLVVAQARIGLWPPIGDSFESLAPGLTRTYRDGRRTMREAIEGGMPHHYHEWRKRVKEHWYHALLLRNIWPPMTKAWAGVLEDLSHTLGDHHDLFVLRQSVAAARNELGRASSVVALLDAIDARQRQLEEDARRIGAMVYAERPRAWLARIRNLWSAWRA